MIYFSIAAKKFERMICCQVINNSLLVTFAARGSRYKQLCHSGCSGSGAYMWFLLHCIFVHPNLGKSVYLGVHPGLYRVSLGSVIPATDSHRTKSSTHIFSYSKIFEYWTCQIFASFFSQFSLQLGMHPVLQQGPPDIAPGVHQNLLPNLYLVCPSNVTYMQSSVLVM